MKTLVGLHQEDKDKVRLIIAKIRFLVLMDDDFESRTLSVLNFARCPHSTQGCSRAFKIDRA